MKIAADTDMCMSLEIHAHVHQMMFTNALSCISCIATLLLLLSVLSAIKLVLHNQISGKIATK